MSKYPLTTTKEEALQRSVPDTSEGFVQAKVEDWLKYIDTRTNLTSRGTDGSDFITLKRVLESRAGPMFVEVYNMAYQLSVLDRRDLLRTTEVAMSTFPSRTGTFALWAFRMQRNVSLKAPL